jgi:hypothetical protein
MHSIPLNPLPSICLGKSINSSVPIQRYVQSMVVRVVLFYKPCAWLKTAGSVKLVLHLNAVQHPENSCSAVSNLPRSLTDITFSIFQDGKYPTILPPSNLNHTSIFFFPTRRLVNLTVPWTLTVAHRMLQ